MTNREKVIHGLECLARLSRDEVCIGCSYFTPFANNPEIGWCERAVMATDALTLLRKQEPAKPTVDKDGWYRCGKCGNLLASGEGVKSFGAYRRPVYCEMCGKKVDWDDRD